MVISFPQTEYIAELQRKLNAAEANRAKALTEYSKVRYKIEEVIKESTKIPNTLFTDTANYISIRQ